MPKVFEKETEEESTKDQFHSKISEAEEVKTLLNWTAPSRPFRKKDHSYYRTIAIIVVLLVFIALLAKEFLLIGVLLSFTFVAYVIAFVPPEDADYKISTQGVIVGDHFYFWHDLDSFWFREKEGQVILFIQTKLRFPGQLMLVLGSRSKEEVRDAVAKFLPFHEIPKTTFLDHWAEVLQKHFPLENIK